MYSKKIQKKIDKLRRKIDNIDYILIKILSKRFNIADEIRMLKIENNIPKEDKKREDYILKLVRKRSLQMKLNPMLIEKVFKIIFKEVKNYKSL